MHETKDMDNLTWVQFRSVGGTNCRGSMFRRPYISPLVLAPQVLAIMVVASSISTLTLGSKQIYTLAITEITRINSISEGTYTIP